MESNQLNNLHKCNALYYVLWRNCKIPVTSNQILNNYPGNTFEEGHFRKTCIDLYSTPSVPNYGLNCSIVWVQ